MLDDIISGLFKTIGHTWNTRNGIIVPTSDDVEALLDAVAKKMHDQPVDTEIVTSGIIVRKQEDGALATYAYVGDYR